MSKFLKWEKNRSMTLKQRNRALSMLEAGMAVTHVARNIGVSLCTITRLRTKFNATGSLKDRPRTGRPRKLLQMKTAILR